MKATGIVRRVDELGRVVLPKELRTTREIKNGDSLEIFVDGEDIVMRKYQPGCLSCGSLDELTTDSGVTLCRKCIRKLAATAR